MPWQIACKNPQKLWLFAYSRMARIFNAVSGKILPKRRAHTLVKTGSEYVKEVSYAENTLCDRP